MKLCLEGAHVGLVLAPKLQKMRDMDTNDC